VTASLTLHASDVRVEIECPPFCARALGAVYGPATRAIIPTSTTQHWGARVGPDGWSLIVDGAVVDSGTGGEIDLTTATETRFIQQLAGWHPAACLLHAGLVELEGVWILFAGDSGRGKSSLTLEVMRRGGRYLTDEFVVTDARTVWAIGRSPVFDFGHADAPLPPWLVGADRDSYVFARADGHRFARPLFAVPPDQWATAPIAARDVAIVRILGRDEDAVVRMTGAEALATLLDASLTREWRQLGPLAADRRSFGISWTSPAAAIDALTTATSHLAPEARRLAP